VCITEYWGAFAQPFLQWKSNKNYILWVRVCSLRFPACNAHVLYCLWPVWLYSMFFILSHKRHDFRKRVFEHKMWGTEWCSWLRYCATSRKVAGSIPDGVTAIFHWHNTSGRTVTLGSTRPLTRVLPCVWRWPVRRADNLTTFMCRLSWNLGASTSWNSRACPGM